jgi:hypothetical protein
MVYMLRPAQRSSDRDSRDLIRKIVTKAPPDDRLAV